MGAVLSREVTKNFKIPLMLQHTSKSLNLVELFVFFSPMPLCDAQYRHGHAINYIYVTGSAKTSQLRTRI